MVVIGLSDEIKRKRGRPRLTDEEREARRIAKNATVAAYHKKNGYAAQKKYKSLHRGERYEPNITMPAANREAFLTLLQQTGMTSSELVFGAVYDKYGIDFRKTITKS